MKGDTPNLSILKRNSAKFTISQDSARKKFCPYDT